MKHTACGEELERLFKESEERRRCLYPNSRSVEKALLRRVEAKEVYSPYPGLFERSCWSAQEYRRLVATRVVKTLAELHPEWVFTSFPRHLCMDYGFHTAASIRFEYARPMPRIDAALSIFGYRVSHRLMSIWKERQTLRGFAKRFWSLLSMPLSTLRCLRLTAR